MAMPSRRRRVIGPANVAGPTLSSLSGDFGLAPLWAENARGPRGSTDIPIVDRSEDDLDPATADDARVRAYEIMGD